MPPAASGSATSGSDGGSGPETLWGRLSQTFVRQPAPAPVREPEHVDFSRMSDDDKRARITGVDPTERKLGIAASVLGVALALYANVPYMVSKTAVPDPTAKPVHQHCSIGHYVVKTATCNVVYPANHYVLPLVVSLVLAAAIYVTVLVRRRAPLAFTMVMTGLAFGSLIVLLPYAAAGGWVMLRAWRTQKYGSPTAKSVMTGWVPPPARGTARRAKSASRRARTGKDGSGTGEPRKPPSANKRYTPKSPPKKKVGPPS